MAELLLRCVAADADAATTVTDVVVAAEPGHTVEELTGAVAARLGVDAMGLRLRGRRLDPQRSLHRVGITSGDIVEVVASPHDRRAPAVPDEARSVDPTPTPRLVLDLVAGPASGRSVPLRVPGRHSIGRAVDAAIRVDDPSVSRHHCTVAVEGDGTVRLEPAPGASNGVAIRGVPVAGTVELGPADVVGIGGTRFVVRPVPEGDRGGSVQFGRIDVHRTPYRPPHVRDEPVEPVGPVPDGPARRRPPVIAMAAPLVAGLVTFAMTRQAQFLVLTLVSPIVMIGSVVDDRRSGRRDHRRNSAAFRRLVDERRADLDRRRAAEWDERHRSAPDLAALRRRAEHRSVDLWARGRRAPDFGRLRLGLGPDRTHFEVALSNGGDPVLRREALEVLDGLDRLDDVPVVADLLADPVIGVHGDRRLVHGVAAALIAQAATLHSPDDLTIVTACPGLEWAKWLPHTRSVVSPLAGAHVVTSPEGLHELLGRLVDLADRRCRRDTPAHWPRLLVVVDADLRPDPVVAAQLLELADSSGISIIWLGPTIAAVPRQATRVLDVRWASARAMRARWWSTDPTVEPRDLEVEHLDAVEADRWARALAPVRDASSASRTTSIPRVVPLMDVLGVGAPDPVWVSERWKAALPGLRVPIGVGADGPIVVDLVEHGPHALIGGTSGSGKSELLQAFVAGLAAGHPPERLTFLFVDYKGGASSGVFARLPHTVGQVTNLSPGLADRALVSLRAELERRMALLAGRAKDVTELRASAPDDAPPALVIVVDEFATLVRDVPEFMAGLVDIAQRGRSLGIHLVLATQRPSGAVDENILANANLRIALRVLEGSESTSIVGVPDAAEIPVPLRGRGIVRIAGPVEFQAPHCGSPVTAVGERPPVLVSGFERSDASPFLPGGSGPTQLDQLLDAVVGAAALVGSDPPRRPWCDELPERIDLDTLVSGGSRLEPDELSAAGRRLVVGLGDHPELQEQRPAVIDLDAGVVVVSGSAGSGRSTVLSTVATSAVLGADDVAVFGIDLGGRGLARLRRLPGVVEVATADDDEAVGRVLAVLTAELDRRSRGGGAPERIVLVVDGLPEPSIDDAPTDLLGALARLGVDGRAHRIHLVLAVDGSSRLPGRLLPAVGSRLSLRHHDPAEAFDRAAPVDLSALPPGRGVLDGATVVQVAVAPDPSDVGVARSSPTPTLMSAPLPEIVSAREGSRTLAEVSLGLTDVTGDEAVVDLTWSDLTVCGPPRSGRSTALATVVHQLAGRHRVLVVGSTSSPLRDLAGLPGVRVGLGRDAAPAIDLLVAGGPHCDEVQVVVVDDADELDPMVVDRLADLDGVRRVVALEERSMSGFGPGALVQSARRSRRLLVLRPGDPVDFLQATGVRLRLRPGVSLPPGRGVLLVDRLPTLVQVAVPPAGTRLGSAPVGSNCVPIAS